MKNASLLLVLAAAPCLAQDALTLQDAVRLAVSHNHAIEAAGAAVKESDSRITEARSGFLPKVSYSQSWTRSDNPVFVFGSLLTQHQFTADNFQLGSLNQPDFLNNFQSVITADQSLYDGGQTRHAVRSAELNRDIASEEGRRTQMDVIAAVVRAYCDVLLSDQQLTAVTQALKSVQSDLTRAESVRDAGMSTDADVLSIRVHLAAVREEQIRRQADAEVARAALNDALGIPLDTPHNLTSPLAAAEPAAVSGSQETSAIELRPESRESKMMTSLAETQSASARSRFLPQVTAHSAFETDAQRFVTRGGTNWLVSIGLQWNLFNGLADKARVEQAQFAASRASAEKARVDSAIRLQVLRASADVRAANERIEVARASVSEAEESLRITQNRYEAGIANVTELLRTETALLDARTRQLAAVRDQRVAAAMLDLATGTLTPDSAVVSERNTNR